MVGARGLCSLSGRKIDSESAWGYLICILDAGFQEGCCVLVLDCNFLRPEQGWQCERQMVPLVVSLPSSGSSNPRTSRLGPSRGAWALRVTSLEGGEGNMEDIAESRGQGAK